MTGRFLHRGQGKRTRTYRYYLCPNHYLKAECAMPSVRAEYAEATVLKAIRRRFEERALLAGARQGDEADTRIADLRATIDAVRRRMARWEAAYEAEAITATELASHLRQLRVAEAEAVESLRALAAPAREVRMLTPEDGWETLAPAQRKAFLRELIDRVTVYPDATLDIAWK
jgi:hypothetical protein